MIIKVFISQFWYMLWCGLGLCRGTCCNLIWWDSVQKIFLKIWKLWWVTTENGESRTHLGKLQGSLVMVFNTTFNNISVIWWLSILLVEETRVSRENHLPYDHNQDWSQFGERDQKNHITDNILVLLPFNLSWNECSQDYSWIWPWIDSTFVFESCDYRNIDTEYAWM